MIQFHTVAKIPYIKISTLGTRLQATSKQCNECRMSGRRREEGEKELSLLYPLTIIKDDAIRNTKLPISPII